MAASALALAALLGAQAAPDDGAVGRGVEFILACQEGPENDQWPYEGVYRVEGEIPIGYRVGGTSIAATALLAAPGWAEDAPRREAVRRAAGFVVASAGHPLMAHAFDGRYDVRGWGYCYGLSFLLALQRAGAVPADLAEGAAAAVRFFIDGLEASAIPQSGGWNYAWTRGFGQPCPSAPFMTGPVVLSLLDAQAQGHDVDATILAGGIAALERSRMETGAFAYRGTEPDAVRDAVPGSAARMAVGEVALAAAGRSSVDRLRGAVDAFIVHWSWLDERRAKPGTHMGRYRIAPYYFYFGHWYAAQAAELLPEPERGEYRRRLRDLLMATRRDDGAWNDRVFPRTAGVCTAMAVLALTAPDRAN
jgi:hypothetical protein